MLYSLRLQLLLLPFCAFISPQPCLGQQDVTQQVSAYNVKHFTDENGLPQNSVKSIVKDSRGNVWLATERGIVRYDGFNFKVFDDFGDSFLYRSIASFHLPPAAKGENEFFAINHLKSFIKISQGRAAPDTMTYPKALASQPFSHPSKGTYYLTEGLPNVNKRHVAGDNYVIPTGNDGYFVYDKRNVIYYQQKRQKKSFPLPGRTIWEFFRVGGRLYHLDGTKLTCFDGHSNSSSPKPVKLTGPIAADPLFSTQTTFKIFWNNCNDQAFILLDKSLYWLRPTANGNLASELVCEGFDFVNGIITNVYLDPPTKRLFLGSHFFGLYMLEPKPFRTYVGGFSSTDDVYYAQVPFRNNGLLTNQGHLFTMDSTTGKVSVRHLNKISETVDWDKFAIIRDKKNRIWCKKAQKLFLLDQDAMRIVSSWQLPYEITQLYLDKAERIWIGTKGTGLYMIDTQSEDPSPQTFIKSGVANISWMQHQSADILWVGTGTGLSRIDISTKKILDIKSLEGIYVRSLYLPEGSDQVWITTYKDGFFLWRAGKLTHFPNDRRGYLASAHCIVEDKLGYFWLTTNKGLFQMRKSDLLTYADKPYELYYHYYDKEAGFNTNEFNGGCQPCAISLGNGTVSLPSINGLVLFRPEYVKPDLPAGGIHIETISVGGSVWTTPPKNLSLDPDYDEVTITANIAYLGNPENLRMAYKLSGNGKTVINWKTIDPASQIIPIPRLQSGEYQLTIRKMNGFGPRNYEYEKIKIGVLKEWYETWWFYGCLVALAAILFYVALLWRTRNIERQKLALAASVRERTRELESVLKALSTSEKKLEQQLRLHIHMIASISHDIRTPIKYVGTALRFLRGSIEKSEKDVALNAVGTMEQTIIQLDQLINNIVSFIKPEMNRSQTELTEVNLHKLVHERSKVFGDINNINGSRIYIDVPPGKTVRTNPDLLGVVVHNLIDNALKAQSRNTIHVYTAMDHDGQLQLVFADQGPGLPEALLAWLISEDSSDSETLPDHGLGIPMIKEIAKHLAIRIQAENNPGASIRLTFNDVHFEPSS